MGLLMPARAFKNGIFEPNRMAFREYLKETRAEMNHVSWPTRAQAVQFTVAVIAVSLTVSFVLFAFDELFVYLLRRFFLKS